MGLSKRSKRQRDRNVSRQYNQKNGHDNSILLSIDPTDINKLTRSFDCMGSIDTDLIYENQGKLTKQPTSPGGYGTKLLSEDREICWVRSFKLNSPELKPIFIEPHPNQLAKLLDKTKPTGRTAKIDRLTFPYLHKTSYSEVVDIINENKDIDYYSLSAQRILENSIKKKSTLLLESQEMANLYCYKN